MATESIKLQSQDSTLFESSIAGVKEGISKVWGKDLPVVLVSGNHGMRQVLKEKGKVKFPFVSLQMQTFGPQETGYNREAMRRIGTRGGFDKVGDYWFNYRVVPVKVTFRVQFACNRIEDLIRFLQLWLFHESKFTFLLESKESNFKAYIQVKSDTEFQVPDENLEDTGEVFIQESTLTMSSYVGKIYKIPTVKLVSMGITALSQEDAHLLEEGGAALEEVGEPVETFTLTFKTEESNG